MRQKYNSTYINNTTRLTLTAMFTALAVITLFVASILPAGKLGAYAISSLFIAGLASEDEVGFSALQFIATSLLGLLIIPNKIAVLPFVLFFGHYGLGKYLLEKHISNNVLCWIFKLIYFNICIFATYFLAKAVLFSTAELALPIWGLVLGAEAVYVIYDIVFSGLIHFYYNRIRKRLIKPVGDDFPEDKEKGK